MISKITLNNVASYRTATSLITDKKVNLIYGLNGTGKSTLSYYFQSHENPEYSHCEIIGLDSESEILVYNQKFINEHFHESDDLKGIFTLSQKNAEAEKNIRVLSEKIKTLNLGKNDALKRFKANEEECEKLITDIKDEIWNIKQLYSGGDRVLEYCFDGLKRKENLYANIIGVTKQDESPSDTIAILKDEINAISGDDQKTLSEVSLITLDESEIVDSAIWARIIVGNQDSTLSETVKKLGNSDWINAGQKYLISDLDAVQDCPFCQSKSITKNFIEEIHKLFDKSYDDDIGELKRLQKSYNELPQNFEYIKSLPPIQAIEKNQEVLIQKFERLTAVFQSNARLIETKLNSPSTIIHLEKIGHLVDGLNLTINEINTYIRDFNIKILNKKETLNGIKVRFWKLMRWQYEKTISSYSDAIAVKEKEKISVSKEILTLDTDIQNENAKLLCEQKKTINISAAIGNIKNGLLDLGIDGFTIENHKDNLYRVMRPGDSKKAFTSLSEGEKMIISFLYFIELCAGKTSAEDLPKKKIVVIDDPISSLSHIYIFNIGQLIKKHFTSPKSAYEQVFVLTHSLYFFYELTFMSKEDRDSYQKLYRITKNDNGSTIIPMKYTEIQNDYQSYWQIIKDPDQSPALIANCMRNIIEYFFTFVEKYELSNVFQKSSLSETKYQAFYRYINRESHSFGHNLFDIKEFDYLAFKDAFCLVFEETGYGDHYKKMMK